MMKMLIVDDETHLVESLMESIAWEDIGITKVLPAYSGKHALEVMEQEAADIVVTDVRMPGINGIELIKAIKTEWPSTACMLLTGHAEFEYAKEGLKHKATHYLLKPVKDEELLAAVQEAAESLHAEREKMKEFVQSKAMAYRNLPDRKSVV